MYPSYVSEMAFFSFFFFFFWAVEQTGLRSTSSQTPECEAGITQRPDPLIWGAIERNEAELQKSQGAVEGSPWAPLAESGVVGLANAMAVSGWSIFGFSRNMSLVVSPTERWKRNRAMPAGGPLPPRQHVWGSNRSFLQISEVGSWVVSATYV